MIWPWRTFTGVYNSDFSGDILTFQGDSICMHPEPRWSRQKCDYQKNTTTLDNLRFYKIIYSRVFLYFLIIAIYTRPCRFWTCVYGSPLKFQYESFVFLFFCELWCELVGFSHHALSLHVMLCPTTSCSAPPRHALPFHVMLCPFTSCSVPPCVVLDACFSATIPRIPTNFTQIQAFPKLEPISPTLLQSSKFNDPNFGLFCFSELVAF